MRSSNKLFGIFVASSASSRHALGGIFDVAEDGTIRGLERMDLAADIMFPNHQPKREIEQALLFPVTEETAASLHDAMAYLAEKEGGRARGQQLFYFGLEPDPTYERRGQAPLDFVGNPRSGYDSEQRTFCRDENQPPMIGTNCRHFLLNTIEKVGGVPLSAFSVGEGSISPDHKVAQLGEYIAELAGNEGREIFGGATGKLHDAGEGRFFYAYDGNGVDVIDRLNQKQHLPDGRSIPEFLLHASQPFYDPSCVHKGLCWLPHEAVSTVNDRQIVGRPLRIPPAQTNQGNFPPK